MLEGTTGKLRQLRTRPGGLAQDGLDAFMERYEHPYLFSLFPISVLLFGLAAVAEVLGWSGGAGFLGLYSMMTFILGLTGYAALYSLDYGQRVYRWWLKRESRVS